MSWLWLAVGAAGGGAAVGVLTRRRHSSRERTRAQLDEQRRLNELGVMAGGLAHEIRHPISSMQFALASAESRLRSVEPSDARREVADILGGMGADLKRIEETIDAFLRYAQPQVAEVVDCDVRDACETVRKFLKVDLASRGVEVACDYPDGPAVVHVPDVRLQQVLVNLLLNAADASPAGSTVVLRVATAGKRVTIDVEDRGTGVAAEHRDRLFEPFFTTKPRGVGLGLALSARLVRDMEGTIGYRPAKAQGSVFTVELPLVGGN